MANDMVRFARGERNIEQLLKDRPDQRGNLLAWKGSRRCIGPFSRTTPATQTNSSSSSRRRVRRSRRRRNRRQATKASAAITGGTYSVFADRLPEPHRADRMGRAYAAYSLLWKQQGAAVDKLPVHHRGELLGGLVQSAQRTGRTDEMAQHLDRMIALMQARRTKQRRSSGRRIRRVRRRQKSRARTATTRAAWRRRSRRYRSKPPGARDVLVEL